MTDNTSTPASASATNPDRTDGADGAPRTAIVTGGSRGIGRAVVARLARDGYAIVIGFGGNRDAAEESLALAEATGARAVLARADVADEQAVAAMFDTAEQEFGGVDVVVHSAGKMSLSTIADLDLDDLDDLHRTNIRGTFVVAREAARRLRPGGALLTFSTSVLGTSLERYGAYAATKGAVEALTLILARELRGRDVTVNAVAPGPTVTELFLEGKDDALLERLAKASPLERLGQPADVAELVAFLASPAGHWVNGQTVRVNGGLI
jgi:3-oxoacyl-[acyl-carrier protein] reductase